VDGGKDGGAMNPIIVTVQGGWVVHVGTEDGTLPAPVVVIDYDVDITDEITDPEVVYVPQGRIDSEPARVRVFTDGDVSALHITDWLKVNYALLGEREEEEQI
jgi:hypothetical protein